MPHRCLQCGNDRHPKGRVPRAAAAGLGRAAELTRERACPGQRSGAAKKQLFDIFAKSHRYCLLLLRVCFLARACCELTVEVQETDGRSGSRRKMEDVRRIRIGSVEPSPADAFDKIVELLRYCCASTRTNLHLKNLGIGSNQIRRPRQR